MKGAEGIGQRFAQPDYFEVIEIRLGLVITAMAFPESDITYLHLY